MWKSTPAGGPERVVALADGVFAIAITLLVLDFSVPRGLDSAAYRAELRDLAPNLGAYVLSLLVLGLFWRDHRRIFGFVERVDGQVITLSLAGLGVAALVPFPTKLISEYGREPVSVAVYAAAVAALGASHLALLAVLANRPWLRGDAAPEEGFLLYGADIAASVVVFALSVPLALVIGPAAMWSWLVLVPVKTLLGRWAMRARRCAVTPPARD
ncbi:TMEM175 family protein [Streptomyces sp. HUAS CX7]|uniref:TMEM175 family protein n=1 Tax=Streptomyces sp. HUAS CX7 TaxID=3062782 RepID=UPI0026EFC96D|nr:TMEM175 family protein [Streptomyces sp. HUAS CX7]WKX17313.1 TMEM175 family protein [Streptomyces sp. HUAS CX7]